MRFCVGVPKDARRLLKRIVLLLRPRTRRGLIITIVKTPSVSVQHDGIGFGVTVFKPKEPTRIIVCSGIIGAVMAAGEPRSAGLEALGETLCHEWLHYEDLCAKRQLTEHGMDSRARELFASLKNQ